MNKLETATDEEVYGETEPIPASPLTAPTPATPVASGTLETASDEEVYGEPAPTANIQMPDVGIKQPITLPAGMPEPPVPSAMEAFKSGQAPIPWAYEKLRETYPEGILPESLRGAAAPFGATAARFGVPLAASLEAGTAGAALGAPLGPIGSFAGGLLASTIAFMGTDAAMKAGTGLLLGEAPSAREIASDIPGQAAWAIPFPLGKVAGAIAPPQWKTAATVASTILGSLVAAQTGKAAKQLIEGQPVERLGLDEAGVAAGLGVAPLAVPKAMEFGSAVKAAMTAEELMEVGQKAGVGFLGAMSHKLKTFAAAALSMVKSSPEMNKAIQEDKAFRQVFAELLGESEQKAAGWNAEEWTRKLDNFVNQYGEALSTDQQLAVKSALEKHFPSAMPAIKQVVNSAVKTGAVGTSMETADDFFKFGLEMIGKDPVPLERAAAQAPGEENFLRKMIGALTSPVEASVKLRRMILDPFNAKIAAPAKDAYANFEAALKKGVSGELATMDKLGMANTNETLAKEAFNIKVALGDTSRLGTLPGIVKMIQGKKDKLTLLETTEAIRTINDDLLKLASTPAGKRGLENLKEALASDLENTLTRMGRQDLADEWRPVQTQYARYSGHRKVLRALEANKPEYTGTNPMVTWEQMIKKKGGQTFRNTLDALGITEEVYTAGKEAEVRRIMEESFVGGRFKPRTFETQVDKSVFFNDAEKQLWKAGLYKVPETVAAKTVFSVSKPTLRSVLAEGNAEAWRWLREHGKDINLNPKQMEKALFESKILKPAMNKRGDLDLDLLKTLADRNPELMKQTGGQPFIDALMNNQSILEAQTGLSEIRDLVKVFKGAENTQKLNAALLNGRTLTPKHIGLMRALMDPEDFKAFEGQFVLNILTKGADKTMSLSHILDRFQQAFNPVAEGGYAPQTMKAVFGEGTFNRIKAGIVQARQILDSSSPNSPANVARLNRLYKSMEGWPVPMYGNVANLLNAYNQDVINLDRERQQNKGGMAQ